MSRIVSLSSTTFEIKAKANNTEAEIIIYDFIGEGFFGGGVSAKSFQKELKALPDTVKNISVRINSPGGDVFDGWTIYNLLRQHKAKVTTYVDGMAASIASIIALAGDKVVMGEGAQMMIHSAWTMAAGNVKDFETVIDRLVTIDDQLIRTYMAKTGKSRSEIEPLVQAETWFTADEAVEIGLATVKAENTLPIAACLVDKATWLHKMPKNIVTDRDQTKKEIKDLKNKIESFLARK